MKKRNVYGLRDEQLSGWNYQEIFNETCVYFEQAFDIMTICKVRMFENLR